MLGKAFALQANELLNALGELLVQAFDVASAVDESGAAAMRETGRGASKRGVSKCFAILPERKDCTQQ